MRHSLFALLPVLAVAVACEGRSLTGPDAQHAFSQGAPLLNAAPNGTLVMVNGARLASGHTLGELAVKSIVSIDVVRGDAASRLFGATAERGAILITTTDSATATRITQH